MSNILLLALIGVGFVGTAMAVIGVYRDSPELAMSGFILQASIGLGLTLYRDNDPNKLAESRNDIQIIQKENAKSENNVGEPVQEEQSKEESEKDILLKALRAELSSSAEKYPIIFEDVLIPESNKELIAVAKENPSVMAIDSIKKIVEKIER